MAVASAALLPTWGRTLHGDVRYWNCPNAWHQRLRLLGSRWSEPVLSQPSEQVRAGGLDKAASGEAGVVGHLCHALWRGHEGLGLLIGGELGLRQDQALQRTVEDVNAQGGHAETRLGQHCGRQGSKQVVLGRRQVRIRDQSLNCSRPSDRHLLGELELAAAV
ncbi:hypothetical protein SCOCK_70156 [Actinacidiphila cocklensis]|uniref:Uncharacterized protein n=1 Tax=Actinacidiphila cocklensis TaxID=887465 RepID=A0A9W4GVD2_9ACTN|nr:hypothetical protein SCOCK_70156 [Actinacidiphila cocklensis]